jgi:F-type H+-transporting ATPase subunit gamma
MAQNLQQLKRKIKTSKNIAQIAKALEMIAASKIKKAQTASLNNKPYADRITKLTGRLVGMVDKTTFSHPYISDTNSSKKLLIAISPDRGLCGSLNTNLYKKLIEIEDSKTKIVTIGKKVGAYAAKLDFELLASFPMGTTLPDFSAVYTLKSIIDEEIEKEACQVQLLYADFVTLFTQQPTVKQLLPLKIEAESDLKQDDSIFEPGNETLLTELLPYYLEVQIYNALLQAFTSEQAAQMVAMQNAKNNAYDIAQHFTLVYNKSRQEKITNEILDLSNSKQI